MAELPIIWILLMSFIVMLLCLQAGHAPSLCLSVLALMRVGSHLPPHLHSLCLLRLEGQDPFLFLSLSPNARVSSQSFFLMSLQQHNLPQCSWPHPCGVGSCLFLWFPVMGPALAHPSVLSSCQHPLPPLPRYLMVHSRGSLSGAAKTTRAQLCSGVKVSPSDPAPSLLGG